jgi:FecR protein
MTSTKWLGALAIAGVLASSAAAQFVISAKSGLVHYTEGEVFLGEAIHPKTGEYPEIKEGQHLSTIAGRAEVLLTPGVFLRLAENSDIVMVSNKLTDTRVEVASGSVILEVGEMSKENSIQLVVGGVVVEVRKSCLFRFDAGKPSSVRVYDGELAVIDPAGPIKVKEGKQMLLTSVPTVEKFAKEDSDSFLRWAGRRSGYLAMANMSAAHQMQDNGIQWNTGGWYFSPLFGMFTYVPMNGRYRNYWDYAYYSPRTFMPPPMQSPAMMNSDGFSAMSGSARGMQDSSGRSYSGGGSASPTYQAPATSAPPSGGGGGGGGRGAASGGSRGGSGGAR